MATSPARINQPDNQQRNGVDTDYATEQIAGSEPGYMTGRSESTSLELPTMKVLKPLPHAVIDYAWAGTMIAAPWLFGFSRNKKAKINAVTSGLGILGLSLFTRYPLGAVKAISFPTHGVIETVAGAMTATAPWLMGFSRNKSAKWTHLMSGLGTLAVVAMTDYQAAEREERGSANSSSGM